MEYVLAVTSSELIRNDEYMCWGEARSGQKEIAVQPQAVSFGL